MLLVGIVDIDECADDTTNPCGSNTNCINTVGSYHCPCKKGYFRYGKKDSKGCSQELIKIILAGNNMIFHT